LEGNFGMLGVQRYAPWPFLFTS